MNDEEKNMYSDEDLRLLQVLGEASGEQPTAEETETVRAAFARPFTYAGTGANTWIRIFWRLFRRITPASPRGRGLSPSTLWKIMTRPPS